jgi:membrane protease YdiL (CAAX protease family)
VAGILLFLWSVRQVRPEQLGLHLRQGRQAVLLGCLAWLVGSPIIFGVNVLTSWLYLQWTGEPPLEHGLLQLMQGQQPYLEWALLVGSALVMAPVIEELLFRGLLLRWAGVSSGHASVLFLTAILLGGLRLEALDSDRSLSQALPELFRVEKCLFLLCLLPGYLLLPLMLRRAVSATPPTPEEKYADAALASDGPYTPDSPSNSREPDSMLSHARGIYATAALFAIIHVWPTPIPLFLLGLLLGWLAYRTQSLVAPITLHFLFNAVACLLVLSQK